MAEKLSVIIALEGAEEIKRQLADVGQAGKDCFNEINKAAAEVGGFNKLDTSRLGEGLVAAGVAGKDVAKVLNAVKQAGRMESLVNGIAAVENGFAKAGAAVGEFGKAMGFVLPSVKTMARLLVLAFGAAVVGAIVSTTKALLELDAQAIKLGVSLADLSKAQEIFKQLGIDSKTAAQGVGDFFEKMQLEKVKEAAGALDEFGRQLKIGADWLKILQDAAKGSGEAADLARQKLAEMGKLDTVLSPAARAIDDIKKSAQSLPAQLLAMLTVFQSMGNTAERNQLIFANFSKEFATAIIQMLNAGVGIQDIKAKLDSLPAPTGQAAEAATRLSLAWERLKTLMASPFSVSPEAMDSITQLLNKITELSNAFSTSQFRADAITQLSQASQGWSQILQGIINLLELLGQTGFNAMKYIEQGAIAAWQTIIGWINKAIEAVRGFFGAGGGQAAGAGAQGMARGGLMGGRGSGTSDSNLAWLSRGEHVMPARAVRQPGVLSLLEALRRSGGNMRSVLDRMGHFAAGGIVGGGMSHVTIAFPGLPPVGGLRASKLGGRGIAQGGGHGAGSFGRPQAVAVFLMPAYTLLAIDNIDFSQWAVRGITMTLEPIDQAAALARDCRGQLADISLAQFRQYKVSISCTDHEVPELTDVWPGRDITITCIPGLGVPNDMTGQLTFLAKVTSWSTSREEWPAETAWSLEAEQRAIS